jgi:hypothetical protein
MAPGGIDDLPGAKARASAESPIATIVSPRMAMTRPGVMAPDRVSTTRARVMRRSTGVPWGVRASSVTTIPAATKPAIDTACNLRIILPCEIVLQSE